MVASMQVTVFDERSSGATAGSARGSARPRVPAMHTNGLASIHAGMDSEMSADPVREPTDFGWFLMQKMDEANLTQSELGRLSGVGQGTLSRWIFGASTPKPDKLRLVAPFIGVDYEVLMALAGYGGASDDVHQALESVRVDLTPEARRINQLLGPRSPLSEDKQRDLRRILDSLIVSFLTDNGGRST